MKLKLKNHIGTVAIKYNVLLFSILTALFSICYGEEIKNNIVISVNVFPNELQIGDTIYVVVQCSNNTDSDRSCQLPDPNNLFQYCGDSIRHLVLIDGEEWEIIARTDFVVHGHALDIPHVLVPSGKTVSVFAL
ncbi:MAG: hypothetical protein LBC74_11265 [Planctomycetaceae bacterium]|jgi:hypothetical protein|nr:hypothetical protein [Planctomycetaceae bacterium]